MQLADPLSVEFLEWCRSEGTPATTIRCRASTLRRLGNAGVATREDLETWWSTRSDRQPSTRAKDLANLRTFYRWCKLWEHRDDDPTRRLKRPKVSPGLPAPVSEEHLRHLLATYRASRPDIYRAIVLGARLGLRVAEAAALTWSAVDREHHTVTILGKGSKARRVAVTDDMLDQLAPAHGDDVSVVTGTTQTLTPAVLGGRVNRAMRAAGVPATFHKLRHRAGTVAYQREKDLVAVSRFLGHASINTTTVYAAAADDAARRIADAL